MLCKRRQHPLLPRRGYFNRRVPPPRSLIHKGVAPLGPFWEPLFLSRRGRPSPSVRVVVGPGRRLVRPTVWPGRSRPVRSVPVRSVRFGPVRSGRFRSGPFGPVRSGPVGMEVSLPSVGFKNSNLVDGGCSRRRQPRIWVVK